MEGDEVAADRGEDDGRLVLALLLAGLGRNPVHRTPTLDFQGGLEPAERGFPVLLDHEYQVECLAGDDLVGDLLDADGSPAAEGQRSGTGSDQRGQRERQQSGVHDDLPSIEGWTIQT